ncbi:MAG: heme-binding protein [Rhodospirillaceae bacterium]|nr:heme-binding protein [Rhodospirillaceae bacterium]MDE0000093.1 heme-binding protein [Rhodospirillaceae bacterium]MDE0362808.1 heme-binding protein [Rhodospirillaceae bacterium]
MTKKSSTGWIRTAVTAFTAATVICAARAQHMPSEFVVSGDAAAATLDSGGINLDTAKAIGRVCARLAEERGVAVSVYVLDNDGNHVYVHRMDGQVWTNVATAEMKARTAHGLRAPSKSLMNQATRNQAAEWREMELGLFSNAGGLPIIVDDSMIGAIGVGGSAPRLAEGWSDEICAHEAMAEVIGPQPPLIEDLPRQRPAEQLPTAQFRAEAPPESALPSEFVVSGAAAARLFDGNQISAAAAVAVTDGCRAWIEGQGGTASIYVIDNTALAVHAERMDGQHPHAMETALLKAETALRGRGPTSSREAGAHNNPGGYPRSVTLFGFYSVAGGVPIVVDNQIIGSVGVSGTDGHDEACAVAGLEAAFGDRATVPVY